MSDLSRIILIIVLLFISAFFTMSENALTYANRFKLKVMEDEGKKSASLVLKMLDKFDNSIINILIGNNIVNVLISVLTTILAVNLLTNIGVIDPTSYASLVATIVSTLAVFFVGEIIPKTIGKVKADNVACIVSYPLFAIGIIFTPIALVFKGLLKLVKKITKVKEKNVFLTEDDFQDIVEDIEQEGLIEEEEGEIIQSAVDFDDLKVKEVMQPLEKVVALDINKPLTKDELIDFICDNNYSRIPVYKDNLNNVIGILHTRILLKELMNKDNYDILKLSVKPLFVSPNMHLDTIFEEFKKNKTHIAIVSKDDATLGIVTMEDVLEELVGDIDESNEGGIEDE